MFSGVSKPAVHSGYDSGTEELAHFEIVASIVRQLLNGATEKQIKEAYAEPYTMHGIGVYPMSPTGEPFTASVLQVTADPVTDLTEDMGAEQKARTTYEHLIDLIDDPDVIDPLRFLREREVVHFQRFGELLNKVYEWQDAKKIF